MGNAFCLLKRGFNLNFEAPLLFPIQAEECCEEREGSWAEEPLGYESFQICGVHSGGNINVTVHCRYSSSLFWVRWTIYLGIQHLLCM